MRKRSLCFLQKLDLKGTLKNKVKALFQEQITEKQTSDSASPKSIAEEVLTGLRHAMKSSPYINLSSLLQQIAKKMQRANRVGILISITKNKEMVKAVRRDLKKALDPTTQETEVYATQPSLEVVFSSSKVAKLKQNFDPHHDGLI